MVLLSLGLVFVTIVNYRTAVRVAEETLRNQGVGLSLELAAEARSLRSQGAPALQALVEGQHRREVAFLAIMDRDGAVLAHSNPDGRFEFRIGANEGKVFSLLVRHKDYAPTLLKDITFDTSTTVRLAKGGAILCKAGAVPGFTAGQWSVRLTAGSLLMGVKRLDPDGTARFANVPAGLDGKLQLNPPGRAPVMAPVKVLAGETVEVDFANLPAVGNPK